MTSTRDLFSSLSSASSTPSVSTVDGSLCSVFGGIVEVSSSLNLTNVLYMPNFPINLLSISKITKSLNYFDFFSILLYFLESTDKKEDWFRPWTWQTVPSCSRECSQRTRLIQFYSGVISFVALSSWSFFSSEALKNLALDVCGTFWVCYLVSWVRIIVLLALVGCVLWVVVLLS